MSTPPATRDVVVRCASGDHRVRLGGGLRFWRSARCPVCRAPVDPWRIRRVAGAARGLARPGSPDVRDRVLWWSSAGYLAFVLAAAVLLWTAGDRWWPATTLLFGPRWTLLLPLLALVPAAAIRDRALLAPLALAALVVAGPVMGFRTGWRTVVLPAPEGMEITVATFNTAGGRGLARTPGELVYEWGADVAVLQECAADLEPLVERLEPDWHVHTGRSLCLVSRFPVTAVAEMERSAFQEAGGSALVTTYTLDVEGTPLHVTNVHLETPRAGLRLIRQGRIGEGIRRLREKSRLREIELTRARNWTRDFPGPHVVAGDFNTPPESPLYREAWEGWASAFSRAGRGLGGTRLNGWIRARIDHVLVNDQLAVASARTGDDVGSDHLPLIAGLRLRDAGSARD